MINNEELENFRCRITNCKKCGPDYKPAVGFGNTDRPKIFFIGMNPWVENNEYKDGRGITILKEQLLRQKFSNFFFDNVIKCELPIGQKVSAFELRSCKPFLERQIELLKPKNIVLFGDFVRHGLGIKEGFWEACVYKGLPTYVFPHFSSVLYGKNNVDEYYNKFFRVLWDIK